MKMGSSAKDSTTGLYTCPAIQNPTLSQLSDIATELNLHFEDDVLKKYHEEIKTNIEGINGLQKIIGPRLPTNYPREPGHKPNKAANPYNAWHWMCSMQGAENGKLVGKRVAIKDNISVSGLPMMNGCLALQGYTPDFDATVVTRVLDAGCKIVGKTVCESMCFSACSSTSAQGPVLNPHNTRLSTGGSSSGNAVVLSIGEADLAIGADQGGSLRIPASWTGVVGLKPTYGLVPYTGIMEGDVAVDHTGPMARTVRDCALLLEIIAGYDGGYDPRQIPHIEVPQYTRELSENGDIKGLRVGLLKESFEMAGADPAVNGLIRNLVHRLEAVGGIVEETSIPLHAQGPGIYGLLSEGTLGTLGTQIGMGGARGGFYPPSFVTELGKMQTSRPDDMPYNMKQCFVQAAYLNQTYGSRVYCRGRNLVIELRRAYDHALESFDVLALPTTPYTAEELISKDASRQEFVSKCFKMSSNTCSFNLTGHPAISVNAGFLDGLPVGLMLVGRHFDDLIVLKVAQAVEEIRDEAK